MHDLLLPVTLGGGVVGRHRHASPSEAMYARLAVVKSELVGGSPLPGGRTSISPTAGHVPPPRLESPAVYSARHGCQNLESSHTIIRFYYSD